MQAPKADQIAQTIRMAEAEMERELEIPAPRAAAPIQQQPADAGDLPSAEQDFRFCA